MPPTIARPRVAVLPPAVNVQLTGRGVQTSFLEELQPASLLSASLLFVVMTTFALQTLALLATAVCAPSTSPSAPGPGLLRAAQQS